MSRGSVCVQGANADATANRKIADSLSGQVRQRANRGWDVSASEFRGRDRRAHLRVERCARVEKWVSQLCAVSSRDWNTETRDPRR
eukprot:scaffold1006_cov270-Pinguiococcus_pyrenoidosus.AAC.22